MAKYDVLVYPINFYRFNGIEADSLEEAAKLATIKHYRLMADTVETGNGSWTGEHHRVEVIHPESDETIAQYDCDERGGLVVVWEEGS